MASVRMMGLDDLLNRKTSTDQAGTVPGVGGVNTGARQGANGGPGNAGGQPGPVIPAPASPGAQPSASQGTGFVNLQTVLDANQDQGKALADSVKNPILQNASTLANQYGKAKWDATVDYNKKGTAANEDYVNQLNDYRLKRHEHDLWMKSNAYQQMAGNVGGEKLNPAARSASYVGMAPQMPTQQPGSLSAYLGADRYGQLQKGLYDSAKSLNNLQTDSGRATELQKLYGGSQGYNYGANALDSMLLGANVGDLSGAKAQLGGLRDMLGNDSLGQTSVKNPAEIDAERQNNVQNEFFGKYSNPDADPLNPGSDPAKWFENLGGTDEERRKRIEDMLRGK